MYPVELIHEATASYNITRKTDMIRKQKSLKRQEYYGIISLTLICFPVFHLSQDREKPVTTYPSMTVLLIGSLLSGFFKSDSPKSEEYDLSG